jgi:hypothetical protein
MLRGLTSFGNILGVMYNQHYLEILGSQAGV